MVYDNSDKGFIYGLDMKTLSYDQLKQIQTDKLVELLPDQQTQILVSRRISNKLEDVKCLENDSELAGRCSIIRNKYNELLKLPENQTKILNNTWGRKDYLRWAWLDEDEKKKEFSKYLEGNYYTCVDELDVKWICHKCPELVLQTIKSKVTNKYSYSYSSFMQNYMSDLKEFLQESNQDTYEEIIKMVEKTPSLYGVFLYDDRNIKDENIMLALRAIQKVPMYKMSGVETKIPITFKHLRSIPPVMKLDVVERLLNIRTYPFDSNLTPQQFNELLFSCVTKYHSRVQKATTEFNKRYQESQEQAIPVSNISD